MKATIYTGNPGLFVLKFEGTSASVIDAFLDSCEDVMGLDRGQVAITDSSISVPAEDSKKSGKIATLVTLLELQGVGIQLRVGKRA